MELFLIIIEVLEMSFVGGLSKIIVVGSIVGCVNASSAIKFDLGSGPCGSGRFGCEFSEGYKKNSDCFDDVNELAKNIAVISSNTMSARSGDFKYIEVSNNFRVVGGTKSPVLFELSGIKSSLSLGKVIFNGSVERPTSVELGFDTGSDMHLPSVDCYNIPMFKVEIGDDGNGGSIAEFKTNMKTGLSYNKCISIDGIKCNNVGREICMFANTGINNIVNADNNVCHTLGSKYNDCGEFSKIVNAANYRVVGVHLIDEKDRSSSKWNMVMTPNSTQFDGENAISLKWTLAKVDRTNANKMGVRLPENKNARKQILENVFGNCFDDKGAIDLNKPLILFDLEKTNQIN